MSIIGTGPKQIPLNQFLGKYAYLDKFNIPLENAFLKIPQPEITVAGGRLFLTKYRGTMDYFSGYIQVKKAGLYVVAYDFSVTMTDAGSVTCTIDFVQNNMTVLDSQTDTGSGSAIVRMHNSHILWLEPTDNLAFFLASGIGTLSESWFTDRVAFSICELYTGESV